MGCCEGRERHSEGYGRVERSGRWLDKERVVTITGWKVVYFAE